MPRFVLAGNNLAAVFVLELLLEVCGPDDLLVITPPEASRATWHASLADRAMTQGVEYITPGDVNQPDVARKVEAHRPDLFLSVYYTQVFRGDLMAVIAGKALNFHPSLLPRHRGRAPLLWAIIDGDRSCGLSVHHIDAGIDTGNLVMQQKLPIHDSDSGYILHLKMANLVRASAASLIRRFNAGKPIAGGRQQTGTASFHSSRDPQVNHLDWTQPRVRIRNVVRALAPPLVGAFAFAGDVRLTLGRVELAEPVASRAPKTPGMVEISPEGGVVVWGGDGALQVVSVVENGRLVPASALVESAVLHEGQVLD